jgi:hypothetical protein
VDRDMQFTKGDKVKVSTSRKRKNKDKNLVGRKRSEDVEVDLEEQNGELMIVVWFLSAFLFVTIIIYYITKSM